MKPERIYKELCIVAERLGVAVVERNLRGESPPAKSGMCKIQGRYAVIIDKAEPYSNKIDLLTSCLKRMDLDNVYLVPAIRNLLETCKNNP